MTNNSIGIGTGINKTSSLGSLQSRLSLKFSKAIKAKIELIRTKDKERTIA